MYTHKKRLRKNMEGCFKSHFSHIRNKVEKVTLRPLMLERCLEPKSIQGRGNLVLKSLQNSRRFFIRFLIDVGSILDPTGHPKIEYFSSKFALRVALGPSWRQEGAQSALRQLWRPIFKEFGTISESILEEISKIPESIFNTTSRLMSHSMLLFPLQGYSSQLQF